MERRNRRRYLVQGLNVYLPEDTTPLGSVVDLSPSGMRLYTSRSLVAGEELMLSIRFPSAVLSQSIMLIDSLIVWNDVLEDGNYQVGVRLNPDEEQIAVLDRAINLIA